MFVLVMIIVLGACVSILGSMYYNTIALQKTYGSINGYYGAYYGALSSVERGLLMSKLKYPTYVGSGGFRGNEVIGSNSNMFSGEFWKLNQGDNSMIWTISSKTDKIVGTIDTKTLRSISFFRYNENENETYKYTKFTGEGVPYGIVSGLVFTGNIRPSSPNIQQDMISTEIGKSIDFNRFFSLNNTGYIVRSLLTKETYEAGNFEKDSQLTGTFKFGNQAQEATTYNCNPRPALLGMHKIPTNGNRGCGTNDN